MEAPIGFSFVLEHKTGKYYSETGKERMIPNGQAIVEGLDLAIALSSNPGIRVCRKAIIPGQTSIEIHKCDLYTDEENAEVGGKEGEKAARGSNFLVMAMLATRSRRL